MQPSYQSPVLAFNFISNTHHTPLRNRNQRFTSINSSKSKSIRAPSMIWGQLRLLLWRSSSHTSRFVRNRPRRWTSCLNLWMSLVIPQYPTGSLLRKPVTWGWFRGRMIGRMKVWCNHGNMMKRGLMIVGSTAQAEMVAVKGRREALPNRFGKRMERKGK